MTLRELQRGHPGLSARDSGPSLFSSHPSMAVGLTSRSPGALNPTHKVPWAQEPSGVEAPRCRSARLHADRLVMSTAPECLLIAPSPESLLPAQLSLRPLGCISTISVRSGRCKLPASAVPAPLHSPASHPGGPPTWVRREPHGLSAGLSRPSDRVLPEPAQPGQACGTAAA